MALTEKQNELLQLAKNAFNAGCARVFVLSKAKDKTVAKMKLSCKTAPNGTLFVLETHLRDGKITQKNSPDLPLESLKEHFEGFEQADLCTENGDALYKTSKKGKELLNVPHSLSSALNGGEIKLAKVKALNKEKNRMLKGDEPFLYELGISDKNGNVLPSRQSKFRQICRFLEFVRDVSDVLPRDEVSVYDLCCGKCYLSFAVYYYFAEILGRKTEMLCADLKADVLADCEKTAKKLGFDGMKFVCTDIRKLTPERAPDLVLSLHACNTATDIVLETAVRLGASAVLSTPCCHRELSKTIKCEELEFATRFGILSDKLCSSLTDGLRTLYLEKNGYTVTAAELIDPDDTPKNVIIRATKGISQKKMQCAAEDYEKAKSFLGI